MTLSLRCFAAAPSFSRPLGPPPHCPHLPSSSSSTSRHADPSRRTTRTTQQQQQHLRTRASPSSVSASSPLPTRDLVSDIMTTGVKVITCRPSDSIDMALELLVDHRITGLPVVDEHQVVVGVVSDFDLLALDTFGDTNSADLFPQPEQTWQAFLQVRKVLAKGTGKRVCDVMTASPITVQGTTSLNDATSLLLRKKIRRLPVVDAEGRLVGLLSRRDIVKSALEARRRQEAETSVNA